MSRLDGVQLNKTFGEAPMSKEEADKVVDKIKAMDHSGDGREVTQGLFFFNLI